MPTAWEPIEDPGQLKDTRLRLMLSHWTAAAAAVEAPVLPLAGPDRLIDRLPGLRILDTPGGSGN